MPVTGALLPPPSPRPAEKRNKAGPISGRGSIPLTADGVPYVAITCGQGGSEKKRR